MLEKFILGLFIMISNMLMRVRGKGVCAGLSGEAAGRNWGRCWEEWKGPEPELLSPSRTSLIFFQKRKEDDLP